MIKCIKSFFYVQTYRILIHIYIGQKHTCAHLTLHPFSLEKLVFWTEAYYIRKAWHGKRRGSSKPPTPETCHFPNFGAVCPFWWSPPPFPPRVTISFTLLCHLSSNNWSPLGHLSEPKSQPATRTKYIYIYIYFLNNSHPI